MESLVNYFSIRHSFAVLSREHDRIQSSWVTANPKTSDLCPYKTEWSLYDILIQVSNIRSLYDILIQKNDYFFKIKYYFKFKTHSLAIF